MHHDYQKGNIVRFDGQEMKIKAVLENPFDGELSGFVVCEPIYGDVSKTKTIHVDELSFENIGDSEGFKI